MADVNANIGVNIDTSAALAQLKALQRQISQFHSSIARSSESAALAQKSLQKNLIGSINSIGAFSAELRTVRTSAESFTNSLEKNKFGMREYFRYAGASTKTFGRLFKSEFDTIGRVAEERVKTLQTQYIKMGRNASGAMEAIAVRPTSLNMQDYGTRTAIAAQKQALFNQLMKQGTTNLLNFGKNTQWAGRQLMVGFTIPLSIVGSTATKTFMEMETQALKFKKVYGDLFTPRSETQAALDNITELGKQFTKYGISVSQTVGLAAEAAAAGFQGLDLQRQTTEATRLSVLGQVDSQKALETTISLQNAFGMSSEKLADSINFLNAVENQTVVSLDDITTAIPKVAPVIQQLGGDVKDLTFFIAAMKEGGINASEGANALKSGLAALINPTKKASEMLAQFGINAKEIVVKNKGDLKATVIEFATALNKLDPLNRAQAIEQMFGKFQFARLSTLFANVAKDGNQAARVLDLANSSVQELSALSEQELGMTADSAMNKFKKSVEDLKVALVPVGKAFLEAATPIVEFVGGVLEKFGNLSDGTKKLITFLTVGIGAIGPIFLMTFGLIANALANGLKGVMILRQGYLRLTGQSQILGEQTQYLNTEQLEAAAAAHSLDQSHAKLTQRFAAETTELNKLIAAYQSATRAAQSFAFNNPGMMMPGRAAKKFASGIVSVPGPKGAGDVVPAMLSPGEAVIPAKFVEKYGPLIQGMVAGNIPGYMAGEVSVGGNVSSLDFARQDTALKAQRLIDAMLADGTGIENALTVVEETLARMASDTKITIDQFVRELDLVTKSITGKQIPGSVFQDAGRGERRFNAAQTGVGTMEEQVAGSAVLEEELRRARGSSNAAQKAMTEYYQSQGKNAAEFSGVVKQAGDVHRAHVITVRSNVDKMFMEAWNPNAWVAQSSTLNQVSNILQSSMSTRDEYFKNLSEINADETIVASIMEKITNNIALTEQELRVQKQVLERMLSSTASMAKVAPGFGPQAAGAVAATQFLMDNPAQQPGVGTRNAQQRLAAEQGLAQAKFRGQESFTPITEAASAVTNQVVLATARAAGTESPSRKTIPIGEDIARGLEVGMQNRQDDVALAGSQLSQAATGGVKGGVTNIPFSGAVAANIPKTPGLNVSELTAKARLNRDKLEDLKKAQNSKIVDQTNQSFTSLNSKIMGGTFALTSLAGVASMAGGNLGKLSGIVFQLSGVMFALSTVLQILPGNFKTFLLSLLKTPGPLLLFTAALAGGIAITKLVNNAREKEKLAINGLADAINMTSGKVKTLAELLGQTPTKRAGAGASISAAQLNTTQKTKVEELRSNEDFLKTYKNDIQSIKNATAAEALSTFKGIALNLGGQGFEKEAIDAYINALALEANKTDVMLKFKEVDLDVSTAKGKENAAKLAKEAAADFNKAFKDEVKITKGGYIPGGKSGGAFIKGGPQLNKNQDKVLKESTAKLGAVLTSTTSAFKQGKTKAADYHAEIAGLFKNLPAGNNGLLQLNAILANVNPEFAEGTKQIADQTVKQQLLKAALLDTAVAQEILNDLMSGAPYRVEGAMKRLKALTELNDEQAKTRFGTDSYVDTNLSKEKSPFQKAKEDLIAQQTELKNSRVAYGKLRAAGISANEAFELSKNSTLAAGLATAKKSSEVKKLLQLTKELKNEEAKAPLSPEEMIDVMERSIEVKYRSAIKNGEAAVKTAEKAVEGIEKEISGIQNSIEKKQRNIELTFNRPIEALQTESSLLSEQLKDIDRAAEGINAKYDLQEKALTKISEINQEIAEQEKGKLGLADALSRGDIAAAASAAQQLRADAAKNAMGRSSGVLQAAREAEIAGLKSATGLTKDQIAARQLEIEKQVFVLEQQKATATAAIRLQEDQIYAIQQGKLLTAQNSLTVARDELLNINDRKDADLDRIKQLEQFYADEKLAEDARRFKLELYTKEVNRSKNEAQGVLDRINALNKTVETVHIIRTVNIAGVNSNPSSGRVGRMYGGMIPKYMAYGGKMGSDSVPAMLTPGEFVMNKQATKSFGPLLSMLNESKYPSMIGSSYDGKGGSGSVVTSVNDNSSSVYNYNVGITVPQSNANPNDIARAVMGQIKYIDNQRIRGQR